ncbi:hypothetical protein SAMN05421841_2864 [Chryseobacterium wanjuense]|jgi:hypothetical protein|uniref:Uncharacterized protein n=1 Tax=Chryseobacterium wanjuense TaxID=356305 RepID=A0A1I0RLF1_9FLAO|nr:hypothetical protein [Chryseobacterium wanjuense]SEW41741.1 hypothetical protein SAMN05421841_2864 [Chryseobacterium wanjuense]
MEYKVIYRDEYYNQHYPKIVSNVNILHPLEISWHYENKIFSLLSSSDDYIGNAYVSDNFLIIRYTENSNTLHFANNLIVYNLNKEIIHIIPPPKPKKWSKSNSIYSLGDKKIIEGKEHIAVSIFKADYNDNHSGQEEIHYLNLENLEYHPSYFESHYDSGR